MKSSEEEEEGEPSEEEEEGESSDGIVANEPFDEVEFGDGDESHQIYCNMSEIIITWNTCKEDTFKVFREEICDMFGVEPNDFYITYHARYIKYENIARDLPHGAWVSINFRLHGSGKRASSSAAKENKEKDNNIETKLMLMRIEEGAKKFVASGVDDHVKSLAS